MINWSAIIIHHSATDDNPVLDDWGNIRKYHMSWRYNGKIITPEEGAALLLEKSEGVESPWHDIGYHWGIEKVNNKVILQEGRLLDTIGAHCIGMNDKAIGICCVGNFDERKPDDEVYYQCALICKRMMDRFKDITLDSIYPHRQFSPKTCPGVFFDMGRLTKYLKNVMAGMLP